MRMTALPRNLSMGWAGVFSRLKLEDWVDLARLSGGKEMFFLPTMKHRPNCGA